MKCKLVLAAALLLASGCGPSGSTAVSYDGVWNYQLNGTATKTGYCLAGNPSATARVSVSAGAASFKAFLNPGCDPGGPGGACESTGCNLEVDLSCSFNSPNLTCNMTNLSGVILTGTCPNSSSCSATDPMGLNYGGSGNIVYSQLSVSFTKVQ